MVCGLVMSSSLDSKLAHVATVGDPRFFGGAEVKRGEGDWVRPPQSQGDPYLPPRQFPPLPPRHTYVEKVRS